jgi:hypothetical protein
VRALDELGVLAEVHPRRRRRRAGGEERDDRESGEPNRAARCRNASLSQ